MSAPHPKRIRAIRELHRNYKWRGVWLCLCRTYPPAHTGNDRLGWWNLIFRPSKLYWQAVALSEGAFS